MLQLYSSPINNFIHHPPIPTSGIQMPNHRKEHKQKSCSKRGDMCLERNQNNFVKVLHSDPVSIIHDSYFWWTAQLSKQIESLSPGMKGNVFCIRIQINLANWLDHCKVFLFFLVQSFLDGNLSGKRCNDRHTTPTKTTSIIWRIKD